MTENTNFLQDQAEIVEKLGEIGELLQLFYDKWHVVPVIKSYKTEHGEVMPSLVIKGFSCD